MFSFTRCCRAHPANTVCEEFTHSVSPLKTILSPSDWRQKLFTRLDLHQVLVQSDIPHKFDNWLLASSVTVQKFRLLPWFVYYSSLYEIWSKQVKNAFVFCKMKDSLKGLLNIVKVHLCKFLIYWFLWVNYCGFSPESLALAPPLLPFTQVTWARGPNWIFSSICGCRRKRTRFINWFLSQHK